MPNLSIRTPAGAETVHELVDDLVTIGRMADNTIVIDDVSVSSHHAQLSRSGSGYVLKDLHSTNGTKVNNAVVEEKMLQPGDRIVFGSVEAVYQAVAGSHEHPVPPPATVSAEVGQSSRRPEDFGNESLFRKKRGGLDAASRAVVGLAVVSLLTFVVAVVLILMLRPPPA